MGSMCSLEMNHNKIIAHQSLQDVTKSCTKEKLYQEINELEWLKNKNK